MKETTACCPSVGQQWPKHLCLALTVTSRPHYQTFLSCNCTQYSFALMYLATVTVIITYRFRQSANISKQSHF